eukprot:CAMPEP_0194368418 /NCGR_PEP_ID=MMETSP0174-20130528/16691_1 /TAXON_ID=216777 /ORGANISM="Proboscia alata, Strain PI-D3" /LENGTH=651 /DNA_ID=CAMNT_0039144807 /DNA_START=61 /DNA_END=2016 /DNA_ORIENTATION=-
MEINEIDRNALLDSASQRLPNVLPKHIIPSRNVIDGHDFHSPPRLSRKGHLLNHIQCRQISKSGSIDSSHNDVLLPSSLPSSQLASSKFSSTKSRRQTEKNEYNFVNPYSILEIERDATKSEIHDSYCRVALLHHPVRLFRRRDNLSNSSEECFCGDLREKYLLFKAAAASYETLKDEVMRRRYDFMSTSDDETNYSRDDEYDYDNKYSDTRDSVCNDLESSAGSEHPFSVPFFSCDDHETRNNYISRNESDDMTRSIISVPFFSCDDEGAKSREVSKNDPHDATSARSTIPYTRPPCVGSVSDGQKGSPFTVHSAAHLSCHFESDYTDNTSVYGKDKNQLLTLRNYYDIGNGQTGQIIVSNNINRDAHSLFESMRKARWNEPFTDPFDLFDSVMQSGVFSISPEERQFFETNVEKLENLEQTFDTLDYDQLEKQRTNMLRSGKTPFSLSPRWDVSTKTQKSRKGGAKKIVSKLSRTILSSPSSLSSVSCNSAFGHRITKIEKVTIGLDGQKETKTKVVKRMINADSDSVHSLISSESSSIDSSDKSYADNYAYFSAERDFGLKNNDGCYGMDSKIGHMLMCAGGNLGTCAQLDETGAIADIGNENESDQHPMSNSKTGANSTKGNDEQEESFTCSGQLTEFLCHFDLFSK